MNEVSFGGRKVGAGHPVFIAAEMSANHDRDLDHALKLVEVAAEAGADAVKLQTYTADSLTVPSDHPSAKIDPIWGSKDLHELYQKAAMPMEFHKPLIERANDLGLMTLTSVYDPRDVEFLEQFDLPAYKVASFELVHLPLLRRLAEVGRPVILSSGMATLAEVEEALDALGATPVVLLQCCSAYPADPGSVNLAAMDVMRTAFNCPVGYSDHTIGTHVACAAVARGACFIEKHYTTDVNRSGPDHRFSLDAKGLKEMIAHMRDIEAAIGTGRKKTAETEVVNKKVGRRSLLAVRDIAAGEAITEDSVRVVRPGSGLHPRYREIVVGRIARRTIPAGHPVTWEDI